MNNKNIAIIILVISLISLLSGYIYAKNQISESGIIIFDTIKDEDWRVENYIFYPPSMTIVLVYSINNPTNITVDVGMDIDFYVGDSHLSNLSQNINLVPGNETTFEIKLAYNSEILEKIYSNDEAYTSFTMDGWYKVNGNVLFYPVEYLRKFDNEDVLSVLPAFDSSMTP